VNIAAGQKIGRYTVVAPIGAGGMGEVYRVRDVELDRYVALKILQPSLAGNVANLRRFEQEARAASALNHPNIVTIYEIGRDGDFEFIAMELVEGHSLREDLRGRPLELKYALRMMVKVAEALAAAHAKGIVHRDLKPENVVISQEGFVKILDFGLAKLVSTPVPAEADQTTAVHTAPGSIFGTASYMSPEQARGRSVDFRSDQFTFGILLYEMLTGRRPFDRETSPETLAAIIRQDPTPLAELQPALPIQLSWIIDRCLAKSPEDRYESTRDLARDLQVVREHLSGSSQPSRPSARPAPVARRQRIALTAAATAIVAAALIGLIVLLRGQRSNAPGPALPSQKILAILPFRDASGQTGTQLLTDGLAETLSARLVRAADLQVIAPSSAPTPPPTADLRTIARQRGANLLLRGTVQRSGDQLRVSYMVLSPASSTELAGDTITGSVADIFVIEDRLADSVLRSLALPTAAKGGAQARIGLERGADQEKYLEAIGLMQRAKDVPSLDAAIGRLNELLGSARDSGLVNAALGRAYLLKFRVTHDAPLVDQAVLFAERAALLDPASPEVRITLGELRRSSGHYSEAIEEFQRALAQQPNSPDAVLGLAETWDRMGRTDDARRSFEKAIAMRPGFVSAYNRLGSFYFAHGQYPKAVEMFTKVTELEPDSPKGYANLGGAYHVQGQYDAALRSYAKSLQIGPSSTAYSNVGTCQYFLGRFAEARASFQKAIDLSPNHFLLWANLGDACRWSGAREESLAAYAKAIALAREESAVNAKNPLPVSTLAFCLAKIGNLPEATSTIQRAMALDPANPNTLYQSAVVANIGGEPQKAIGWLQRAVEAGASRDDVAREPEFRNLSRDPGFLRILGIKADGAASVAPPVTKPGS
jgi:serine/threonine protein kinase/tetratricopeptide (TPR) repeat protein